jgi:hypothetical protein
MTFEEVTQDLEKNRNLHFLKEKTDNVSNKLFIFTENGTSNQFVLKGLRPDDFEIKSLSEYLPKIEKSFNTLVLPQLLQIYKSDELVYLLIPYYHGDTFDFNTPDINLTGQLVEIVKDLSSVDVETVIANGNNFDYRGFESEFWKFFQRGIDIDLIDETKRSKCLSLLGSGRNNQHMIISNGDFNPRNVIRLGGGKLVLIDWNGIVSPLEHMLTYPWLLNWQNPEWQSQYASQFEKELPVENSRIRMHLMNISLKRAVDEKKHGNLFADNMARNHIKNYNASLEGISSLVELCGYHK